MREYVISSSSATATAGLSVAGATTLVFVNPAAAPNVNIEFLRYWASQAANTSSAQQRIQTVSQVTAFPTLTSATPAKLKLAQGVSVITGGTAGAAGTSGINASAEGAGTKTVIGDVDDAFNALNGYLNVPTVNDTLIVPAGFASGIGLWFPQAPVTLTGWNWGVKFREV